MNPYLNNLGKIEFVVTYACTGKCRHCSAGDHDSCGETIDPQAAADAVKKIVSAYSIKTVMTFGGEPLLAPDAVYRIHKAASEMNVPKRQLITNGYFSNKNAVIADMAEKLAECGINEILLSVDAFHQESIPINTVKIFAAEVQKHNIPILLQPAWLVDSADNNPYNRKTKEILAGFGELQIPVNEGNIIFPEGNAKKYLSEYFEENAPINPYEENPYDIRCLSFEPNGNVLNDNLYHTDIMDILKNYAPEKRMRI